MKLEQVCDIISGKGQKTVECPDGKYPIYGSGGIIGYASDYLCESGATIIGRKGSINNPIYVQTRFWNVDTAFGLLPKPSINSKLFYYFCLSYDFSKMNKGTTIPSLVKSDLLQIKIPFIPSLVEQQHIVDILDKEFAKIEKIKNYAELNLLNAKYLFQAALKKELEPKEGWSHRLLKDICEGVSYGTSLPSVAGGKYKYLRMGNITSDGELVLNNIKFIDVPESEKEKCIVRKGDILFNRTNSRELVGKTCLFDEDEDMVIAGYIIRVRVKSEVLPKFVVYHLNKPETKAYLRTIATGAVHQSNINATNLQSVEIDFPNVEEQALIVSKIDIIKQQAIRLQDNYTKTFALCDDLKQSLLRKAFNGEL